MNQRIIDETKYHLTYSYAPYSNFKVAACVVTTKGNYFGVNVENASYSLTNCAERSALFSAYSNGVSKEDIHALYVVTTQPELIYPCGSCRQVIMELMDNNAEVIVANDEQSQRIYVQDLMPNAFKKEVLL